MPAEAWRTQLTTTLPRQEIPPFLVDLQALVAKLRGFRDDLRVPEPADLESLLTPRLRAHPELVTGYLDDARYRDIVAAMLEAGQTRP